MKIENGYLYYNCGCSFKLKSENPLLLDPSGFENDIRRDCPLVWLLLESGNTKGVFQLESRLGQIYAKKMKPKNIEEWAALIALIRPGCLNAQEEDGKSITEHYIKRMYGEEEIIELDPIIGEILKDTQQYIIYQESSIRLGEVLAGMSEAEADFLLRKGIGKKIQKLIQEAKTRFLEGCEKEKIISSEIAKKIFDWIEASGRYSFNKSHSTQYGLDGYTSAYCKTHFPTSFFASCLYHAKDKPKPFDEIKILVNNAKSMGIDVMPPDLRKGNPNFKRIGKSVYFGFTNCKGIGKSSIQQIKNAIYQAETSLGKPLDDMCWTEFLFLICPKIGKSSVHALAESGAIDFLKTNRQKMIFEYEEIFENYKIKSAKRELPWICANIPLDKYESYDILSAAVEFQSRCNKMSEGPFSTKNRIEKCRATINLLKNPPYSISEDLRWVADVEEARLGISLSTSRIEACPDSVKSNCTCAEVGTTGLKEIILAVELEEVKEYRIKNGQRQGEVMCFLSISDNTQMIDAVIFSEDYEEIKRKLVCVEGNSVLVKGYKNRDGGLVIKDMWQI